MNAIISHQLSPWLILHFAPNFGPASWKRCLENFTSPATFCAQSTAQLRALGCTEETVNAIKKPDYRLIESAIQWQQQPNHHIISCHSQCYPKLLKQIDAPPPLLYVHGQPDHLYQKQIAIVGTRRPTANAKQLARYFGEKLGEAGLVTTSGLALGVDTAAHEGAVASNTPTIAVSGNGLNMIYPAKNRNLAAKIAEKGAIVSEFALFTPPKPENFPRRNRIISGLSLGVLVIEAALKSGSLITARYALEQNREVFATPGSLFNSMSAGCNHLIQQGARLVTNVDDILSEISGIIDNKILNKNVKSAKILPPSRPELDKAHKKLLECMKFDVISFEQLVDETGFAAQKVTALLCQLKLNGYIREESGRFIRVNT